MNEKRILWRKQVAAILKNLMEKCPYSEASVKCDTENPLFLDAYNFIQLHHELSELRSLLLRLNLYEEICKDC